MTFNAAAEFAKAGLTPDQNGEYKMGLSEMARFGDYQDRQQRDLMMGHHWADDEEDDDE